MSSWGTGTSKRRSRSIQGLEAMISDDQLNDVRAACSSFDADVFFYNGNIVRSNVLTVMQEIKNNKNSSRAVLLLVTYGGDPHAAFKIARYIQDKYDHFTLFVSGYCKSAGTLLAIAANEIVFTPFGELGPLDVQMTKPDHFQYDSGLVIGESLDTLERRAADTFKKMFDEIISENQGQISVSSAMHAASEVTKAIFAPIMARIDPEEIGVRQRALRIALDYGRRLELKSQNTRDSTVRLLAEKYSSHSFVIDSNEASALFRNVRLASDKEMDLILKLGKDARLEQPGSHPPTFICLTKAPAPNKEHAEDGSAIRPGNEAAHVGNSSTTNGKTVSAPARPKRAGGRKGPHRQTNSNKRKSEDRSV